MAGSHEGAADSCPSLVCTAGQDSGDGPFRDGHRPPVGLFPQILDGRTDAALPWASRAPWRPQTGLGSRRHTCCVISVCSRGLPRHSTLIHELEMGLSSVL